MTKEHFETLTTISRQIRRHRRESLRSYLRLEREAQSNQGLDQDEYEERAYHQGSVDALSVVLENLEQISQAVAAIE